jgi:hypothetical protein
VDQQSLPALVSRYIQLKANGAGFVGKCVFHDDDGESLRVDEKSWRCLNCGAHDGQSDAAGWLMAWSQCSREDAEHQLSNGGLPEVIPIQVPPLRKLPFWGWKPWLKELPKALVWIHETAAGVHAGRELFPDRVHLGICQGCSLDDLSLLPASDMRGTGDKLRPGEYVVLVPINRESSFEKMDDLARRFYAAGHNKVRLINLAGRYPNGR